jgi:hypothetical protein
MENAMGRAYSMHGEKRKSYKILMVKSEENKILGRLKHRTENDIKMDLRDIGWGGKDWIDLDQDRDRRRALVNKVMQLRVP